MSFAWVLGKYNSVISQNCGFAWLNKSFPRLNTVRNSRLLRKHCQRREIFLQSSNLCKHNTRKDEKEKKLSGLILFLEIRLFHGQGYWQPRFGSTLTAKPYEFSVNHFPFKNLSAWFWFRFESHATLVDIRGNPHRVVVLDCFVTCVIFRAKIWRKFNLNMAWPSAKEHPTRMNYTIQSRKFPEIFKPCDSRTT